VEEHAHVKQDLLKKNEILTQENCV